jgi:16S rRNA pseudouridine516 synthase
MAEERLDKILSGTGLYTRSEARAAVTGGRVAVDGRTVLRPEQKVLRTSCITADGAQVDTAEFIYYMLYKPAGCVSAVADDRWPTAVGLFPAALRARGIFPVGRLDMDVTGLLIVTDDGGYAHRVTSPRSGVDKVYEAQTDGELTAADEAAFSAGIVLPDGTRYRPAKLEISSLDSRCARVTVTEGKYHEVKNLFEALDRQVLALRRVRVGQLCLDLSLRPGEFRRMKPEEAELAVL